MRKKGKAFPKELGERLSTPDSETELQEARGDLEEGEDKEREDDSDDIEFSSDPKEKENDTNLEKKRYLEPDKRIPSKRVRRGSDAPPSMVLVPASSPILVPNPGPNNDLTRPATLSRLDSNARSRSRSTSVAPPSNDQVYKVILQCIPSVSSFPGNTPLTPIVINPLSLQPYRIISHALHQTPLEPDPTLFVRIFHSFLDPPSPKSSSRLARDLLLPGNQGFFIFPLSCPNGTLGFPYTSEPHWGAPPSLSNSNSTSAGPIKINWNRTRLKCFWWSLSRWHKQGVNVDVVGLHGEGRGRPGGVHIRVHVEAQFALQLLDSLKEISVMYVLEKLGDKVGRERLLGTGTEGTLGNVGRDENDGKRFLGETRILWVDFGTRKPVFVA